MVGEMQDYQSNAPQGGIVGDLQEFESASIVDVYQFEGKQIQIERIKIDKILSQYGPDGMKLAPGKEVLAPILRVETVPIFKGKNAKGEDYELRASEIFSLKEREGKLGWSKHPKGSLNKFLKKMRATHPKELIGKIVLTTTRPTSNPEVTYLGFVKE